MTELSAMRPGRRTVLLGMIGGVTAVSACSTDTASPGLASSAPGTDSVARTATSAQSTSADPGPAPTSTSSVRSTSPLLFDGPDITTGPPGSTAVALTFHGAGAPALTASVLASARAAGARITVFAVGQWLSANPSLGHDLVAAGHDLGNHTWSHQVMTGLTVTEATREVKLGADAVSAVVGTPGLLFRPSGTPHSTATITTAARAAGYQRCVSYDVDPLDYTDPGADQVRSRTLAAVRPGSIISLHLGYQGTVDALPGILMGLKDRGLAAVTVTSLLSTTS